MGKARQGQSEGKRKNKSPQGWDIAIAKAQMKIDELKRAVSIFEDQKRRGEPWPGNAEGEKKIAA
jgi:hypothetical protein